MHRDMKIRGCSVANSAWCSGASRTDSSTYQPSETSQAVTEPAVKHGSSALLVGHAPPPFVFHLVRDNSSRVAFLAISQGQWLVSPCQTPPYDFPEIAFSRVAPLQHYRAAPASREPLLMAHRLLQASSSSCTLTDLRALLDPRDRNLKELEAALGDALASAADSQQRADAARGLAKVTVPVMGRLTGSACFGGIILCDAEWFMEYAGTVARPDLPLPHPE